MFELKRYVVKSTRLPHFELKTIKSYPINILTNVKNIPIPKSHINKL